MALEAGSRAPYFSMVAAGSGRRMSLREAAGLPLVLIFHGRDDEGAARGIKPDKLIVASVIDLSFVPPFYWMAANVELDRAYSQAAADLPEDAHPRDYILILPDWMGSTTRKYRVRNTSRSTTVIVVDEDSTIEGVAEGEDVSRVIELLARVIELLEAL